MIGGVGPAAQFSYRSPVAGPERTSRPSHPGKINQFANERAAQGGNASSPSSRVKPAEASRNPRDLSNGAKASGEPLSEEEQRQVQKLKETDAEVQAHENAHAAAGGPHAAAPKYEYTTGPDGKRYATSGEVQIDTSAEQGEPEATIRKMDIVLRAALAPADPSSQDLAVARQAQSERAKAQGELSKKREAEALESKGGEDKPNDVETGNSSPPLDPRLRDALTAYRQAVSTDAAASTLAIISGP